MQGLGGNQDDHEFSLMNLRKPAHRLFWAAVKCTWPALGLNEITEISEVYYIRITLKSKQYLYHLLTLYISIMVTLHTRL